MSYSGYDIEDAIVLNKGSLDRYVDRQTLPFLPLPIDGTCWSA